MPRMETAQTIRRAQHGGRGPSGREATAKMFEQPSTSTAIVGARITTGGESRKRSNSKRAAAHYGVSSQRPGPAELSKKQPKTATSSCSQQGVEKTEAETAKRSASEPTTGKETHKGGEAKQAKQADQSEHYAESPLPALTSAEDTKESESEQIDEDQPVERDLNKVRKRFPLARNISWKWTYSMKAARFRTLREVLGMLAKDPHCKQKSSSPGSGTAAPASPKPTRKRVGGMKKSAKRSRKV